MPAPITPLVKCKAAAARVTYDTARKLYYAKGENPLPSIPKGSISSPEHFFADLTVADERSQNNAICEICGDKCALQWDIG